MSRQSSVPSAAALSSPPHTACEYMVWKTTSERARLTEPRSPPHHLARAGGEGEAGTVERAMGPGARARRAGGCEDAQEHGRAPRERHAAPPPPARKERVEQSDGEAAGEQHLGDVGGGVGGDAGEVRGTWGEMRGRCGEVRGR